MKKVVIFTFTFILLFFLFQVLSGVLLTYAYTPDVADAWKMASVSSEEVIMTNNSVFPTLPLVVFAFICSYYASKRFSKTF